MKIILVPIDFSEQSLNAVDYAAEMAHYTKAKLILLHVYDNAPPALDIPMVVPSAEIESDAREKLNEIAGTIEGKYGDQLILKSLVKLGFVVEEINVVAEENTANLIVMGMQGAGYLTERLLGSMTTLVIRKSRIPVLVVGKQMQFKKLNKILLATDGNRLEDANAYLPLKKLLKNFEAHLYVVHVMPEMAFTPAYDDVGSFRLDEEWLSHSLSFHHITNDDMTDGINQFIQDHEIEMVVMVPHKHSFFERLVKEPYTHKMAFHSIVPLLTLPE